MIRIRFGAPDEPYVLEILYQLPIGQQRLVDGKAETPETTLEIKET
jgi:hypothetical protein